ncbi:MAG: PepSY domain-containing protein [Cypionkella sp.]
MSLDRLLKTLHGWLGVMILPWIVIAGLTGLYENHAGLVLQRLPYATLPTGEILSLLREQPQLPLDAQGAGELAGRLLPAGFAAPMPAQVFGRPGYEAHGPSTVLRIDAATGAYLLQGDFVTTFHSADGSRIAKVVNWGKLFVRLHRAGWASDQLGTWPADVTALALMLFGASGMYLFFAPRVRKMRNRGRR